MKNISKGGLVCLLSCLLCFCSSAQSTFLVQKDPAQKDFGVIASPILEGSKMDVIESKAFTFEQWGSFFNIRTSASSRQVLGDFHIKENRIYFTPRFLPDPEVQYVTTFSFERLGQLIGTSISKEELQEVITFDLPNKPVAIATKFSPSPDTLPANLLRAYLYFSNPMGFDNPYDHVSLINSKGEPLQDVFVELPEGLWNEDRTRLTLLFHPGRIKRGVGPNVKQGNILTSGEQYQFIISKEWKDVNGTSLIDSFQKEFIAGPALRTIMKLEDWSIDQDIGQNRIIIDTKRSIDIEMAGKMITIVDEDQIEIPFELVQMTANKIALISLSFQSNSNYSLQINPKLEDVCGNTFLNPFDYKEGSRKREAKTLTLPFTMN